MCSDYSFRRWIVNEDSMFIRHLTEEDLPQIIEQRIANNFHDAVVAYSMFLKTNPTRFIIIDDGFGKVVGMAGVFINNSNLSTAGYRVIHPDYRNLRITSKKIHPKVLEIANGRCIIGHAKIHLVDWMLRHGFHAETQFFIIKYISEYPVDVSRLSSKSPENVTIEEFQEPHLEHIADYDSSVVGYDRKSVLRLFCAEPMTKTFAAFKGDKCIGYGVASLDIHGWCKLGPLHAEDPTTAEVLLGHLLKAFPTGKSFKTVTFSNNDKAQKLFGNLGPLEKIVTYRFYTKIITSLPDTKNIYACLDIEYEPF